MCEVKTLGGIRQRQDGGFGEAIQPYYGHQQQFPFMDDWLHAEVSKNIL